MFGAMNNGAATYAKMNVENGVTAASPHKLIVMLFDGAMVAITNAKRHMLEKDIPAKGEAISRAITIIENGLIASLNKSAGGEVAENLEALYAFINNRLLMANLNNQPELLDEAYKLLKDLREAWEAIGPKAADAPQPAVSQPEPAANSPYGSIAPAAHHFVKA